MNNTPPITATQIAYLHLCHRKLWLVGQGIRMENVNQNQYVDEGKLISESTYQRRPKKWKELALEGIKIDHFDSQTNTVKEVKKSAKLEHIHVAQVQYYLYRLQESGIEAPKGLIEYPKQRKTKSVEINQDTITKVEKWKQEIKSVKDREDSPAVIDKPYCKRCAYYDFCYV